MLTGCGLQLRWQWFFNWWGENHGNDTAMAGSRLLLYKLQPQFRVFFSLAWVKYQLSWYKKMLLIFLRWPVITISDTVLSKIYWLFILCPCNSHIYNRQSNKVLCSKIASTNAIVKVFNYFKISIPREVLKIQCSKCRWKDTF